MNRMNTLVPGSLFICLSLFLAFFIAGCEESFLTGAAPVEITTVEEVFDEAEAGDPEEEGPTGGTEGEASGIEEASGEEEEATGTEIPGSGPETHTIEMNDEGFSVEELMIKAGDTIIWQNVRQGRMKGAMVIGMRECRDVKSRVFNPGESFSWTFKEAGTCTIVDGIYTEEKMEVVVE